MSRRQLMAVLVQPGCWGSRLPSDVVKLIRPLVENDAELRCVVKRTIKSYNFDRVIDFTLLQRCKPDERVEVVAQQPAAILSIPVFERTVPEMEACILARPSLINCLRSMYHVHLATVNPDVLQYLQPEQQTEELCLAAVRVSGRTLKWVNRPTPPVCWAAVRQSGLAIEHVPAALQTEELSLEAVRSNADALFWVAAPSQAVQLAAVQTDGQALRYISRPSPQLICAALHQSCHAIRQLKLEPKDEFIDQVLKWNGLAWLSLNEKQRNHQRYLLARASCNQADRWLLHY